jgi:hypothetical protein
MSGAAAAAATRLAASGLRPGSAASSIGGRRASISSMATGMVHDTSSLPRRIETVEDADLELARLVTLCSEHGILRPLLQSIIAPRTADPAATNTSANAIAAAVGTGDAIGGIGPTPGLPVSTTVRLRQRPSSPGGSGGLNGNNSNGHGVVTGVGWASRAVLATQWDKHEQEKASRRAEEQRAASQPNSVLPNSGTAADGSRAPSSLGQRLHSAGKNSSGSGRHGHSQHRRTGVVEHSTGPTDLTDLTSSIARWFPLLLDGVLRSFPAIFHAQAPGQWVDNRAFASDTAGGGNASGSGDAPSSSSRAQTRPVSRAGLTVPGSRVPPSKSGSSLSARPPTSSKIRPTSVIINPEDLTRPSTSDRPLSSSSSTAAVRRSRQARAASFSGNVVGRPSNDGLRLTHTFRMTDIPSSRLNTGGGYDPGSPTIGSTPSSVPGTARGSGMSSSSGGKFTGGGLTTRRGSMGWLSSSGLAMPTGFKFSADDPETNANTTASGSSGTGGIGLRDAAHVEPRKAMRLPHAGPIEPTFIKSAE